MAVVKIWPVKQTVEKCIDYIIDPAKTDDRLLISSYRCAPETAAIEYSITRDLAQLVNNNSSKAWNNQAFHLIQSFDYGEITPELAHELGQQLADEVLGGKYEYVLSTHIDKGHVHNHIVFNAVSHETLQKYNDCKKSYWRIRHISDRLCEEHNLSVIREPKGKGQHYKEWDSRKKGVSWKAKLQETIDNAILQSADFDSFLINMKAAGYEIKTGKHLSYRATGQERFTRGKTIGDEYSEEGIRRRIAEQAAEQQHPQGQKRYFLRGDLSKTRKASMPLSLQIVYTSRREHQQNIENIAAMLKILKNEEVRAVGDFEKRIDILRVQSSEVKATLKNLQQKQGAYKEAAKYLVTYKKYEEVYSKFESAFSKKGFYKKHESEILAFEYAKKKLESMGLKPDINLEVIAANIKQQEQQIKEITGSFQLLDARIERLRQTQKEVEKLIGGERGKVDIRRTKEKEEIL